VVNGRCRRKRRRRCRFEKWVRHVGRHSFLKGLHRFCICARTGIFREPSVRLCGKFLGRKIRHLAHVPIGGRIFYTPDVRGAFELHGDLEKLPNGMGPLNPRDPRPQIAALAALSQLQGNPRVFRQVMLRRVPASIEVQSQRGGALLEWLAQQIDPANDQRDGLRDAFAAAALGTRLIGGHVVHHIPSSCVREDSTLVGPGREVRRPGGNARKIKLRRFAIRQAALAGERRRTAAVCRARLTTSSFSSRPRSLRRHRP